MYSTKFSRNKFFVNAVPHLLMATKRDAKKTYEQLDKYFVVGLNDNRDIELVSLTTGHESTVLFSTFFHSFKMYWRNGLNNG